MAASARGSRAWIVAAVMASMAVIAIEATVVSTAMPFVVAQLGGMDIYSWSFAVYLLAQTTTPVVFGKLADTYGRKPVIYAGFAVFLLGSLLAGLAWSMPSLIVFRLLQGVGAGAVQPIAMTVVADLYPPRERGKVQGYLASVWAVAAVAGPLAGAAIVQHLSWPWIFWAVFPFGLAAVAVFATRLEDHVEHASPSIDYLGALLFTVSVGSLMFALSAVGTSYERFSLEAAVLFAAAGIAFVLHARRASDPIVSFELWMHRAIAPSIGVAALGAVALMGLTAFLPMYVQTVLHRSPLVAGLTMTTMLLGWPVGATTAAHTFQRFGLRNVLLLGAAFQPIGAACFLFLGPQSPATLAAVGSGIMGLGMGLLNTCALVLVQEAAPRGQRGAATATNIFARNLGSAFGATVFGVVVNLGLAGSGIVGKRVTAEDLKRLLEAPRGTLGLDDAALVTTLHGALHTMFVAMFVVTLLVLCVAMLVPDTLFRRRRAPAEIAND
ncbi:MAG: MFS transporter [Burkholderiales bacterium]